MIELEESACLMKSQCSRQLSVIIALIMLLLSMFGCSNQEGQEVQPINSGDPLLRERAARNAYFKSDANSPIPAGKRNSFKGLEYFPINKELRFTLRLNRYPNPEQIRLGTNTGEIRSGLRYGYFEFTVNGQMCRLQVYRMDSASGNGGAYLFVPFRDATSGQETYASGRYIDLTENTSGIYELDFNRAYNPYCAFNNSYSCPIPPSENTLSVPISAGEKIPPE
jgi:uncharacterized protein (DUF1684 family)